MIFASMMKRILVAFLLVVSSVATMMAQDLNEARKVEIAWPQVGYFRASDTNYVSSGLDVAVTITDRFAIVGELRSSISVEDFFSDSSSAAYRGGVRYSERRGRRATLFVQGLAGGVTDYTVFSGSGTTLIVNNGSGFSFTTGGGVDIGLKRWLGVRVVEAAYEMARVGGQTSNGFRINGGLVFRIGAR